ncbi:type IV secretory system conjugative DNA transfer family protein (plasmid) [Plesiomonas shigelloides]|nr:type IV secretory system conjugative DNA transfer family protein [Plesiomonas shigelloides]
MAAFFGVYMRKYIGLSLAIIGLPLLGLYLSGCVYFMMQGGEIGDVTLLSFIQQWQHYHADPQYEKSLNIAAMAGFGCVILLPLLIAMAAAQKKPSLHGDARFATFPEVQKQGLTKPGNQDDGKGILIGRMGRAFLYYMGAAFVLLAAPSRGGKGIGVIIPNLLRWWHSCVVTDFKQENFSITSKFREKVLGQKVFLFNPYAEDGKTHRYNPLGYVRDGHLSVPDILAIAEIIYPTSSGDSTAKYFAALAQNLFLGLALYVKYTPSLPFTIGEIVRQSKGYGKPLDEHLTSILESRKDLPDACVMALQSFLAEDKERGQKNVLSSFSAPLIDWTNPIFDAATSANDFDLNALRRERMTIYIGITPDYIPVSGRILNLFFSHLISLNTKELPEQNLDLKYKCLLLMDEFTAMGQSAIIGKSNNYFAGYGLQLLTIVQNPAQIYAREPVGYGAETAKTLIGNHEAQLFYTPEKEDAEALSGFLGNITVKVQSEQRTTGKSGRSITTTETKRPLMLPQELREMPFKNEIILMRGQKPIFCEKIHYFKEPIFINRLKQVSPSLAAIKGIPTKKQLDTAIAMGELATTIPLITLENEKTTVSAFESPLDDVETVIPSPPAIQLDMTAFDTEYSDSDTPDF